MNRRTTLIFSIAVAFILVLSLSSLLQASEDIKCPVSGKTFNKSDNSESHVYKGKTYYFCCPGCKESFVKDPEKYVKALEEGKEAPGHDHAEHAENAEHAQEAEGHEHAEDSEHAHESEVVKCAVMGHEIKDLEKAPKSEYKGKTYYFCCADCKDKFDKEPGKYVKGNGQPVICPVMGNEVKDLEKAPKVEYKGKTYYFCCEGCVEPFKADPEKYIK